MMHKTKRFLFLCLSLLFTAQTIAEPKVFYRQNMAESSSIPSADSIVSFTATQTTTRDVLNVVSTASSLTAFISQTGKPPTDSLILSATGSNTTSTTWIQGNLFATLSTSASGTANLHSITYSRDHSTSTNYFTGFRSEQAFNSLSTKLGTATYFSEDSSLLLLFAIDNSTFIPIYQVGLVGAPGRNEPITLQPTQTVSTVPADVASDLFVSTSPNYTTVSYVSGGNGKIVRMKKISSTSSALLIIDTTPIDVGPSTKTPQTYTHDDGSITVMGIDTSQNLIHQVINKNGETIVRNVLDVSVTEMYFSANADGFVVSYKKTTGLYASTATFPSGKGELANPSPPRFYMIGTKPHAQAFQSGQYCFGGMNTSQYHEVYSITETTTNATLIYRGSQQSSSTLSFLWARLPGNFTLPREEINFVNPLTGNQLLITGVTSSFNPVEVLNHTNSTQTRIRIN